MKLKVRSLEFGVRSILIFILLFTVHLSLSAADEKWPGVDESVIEKVAKEHGREARGAFIPTDRGDLLFFGLLLSGVVGVSIGGYYWRSLTEKRVDKVEILKKDV